jgi:hypothetical protein
MKELYTKNLKLIRLGAITSILLSACNINTQNIKCYEERIGDKTNVQGVALKGNNFIIDGLNIQDKMIMEQVGVTGVAIYDFHSDELTSSYNAEIYSNDTEQYKKSFANIMAKVHACGYEGKSPKTNIIYLVTEGSGQLSLHVREFHNSL